jgi:YidC/Oxa1 family membrane protein insertase
MDKNTILAFVLIAVIIIIYPFFMPKQVPIQKEQPVERVQDVSKDISQDRINVSDSVSNQPLIEPALTADTTPDSLKMFLPEEKEITIETDLYSAVFSTKNGAVKSWKAKHYKSREDTSRVIELVNENTNNLNTEIYLKNGTVLKDVIYEADKEKIELTGAGKTEDLILTYKDASGKVLYTKAIKLYSDKYSFDLSIDTTPIFSELSDAGAVKISWPDGVKYSEVSDGGKNLNREDYYRATYYKKGDDFVEYDNNDKSELITGSIDWGSTRSKYFEVFFAAKDEKLSFFQNFPAYADAKETFHFDGVFSRFR